MPAAKPPTTTLSALTASALGAIVTGVAGANEVSRSLVPVYAKDEALRRLGVPVVELQELTLTLRFVAIAPAPTKKSAAPDLVVALDPASMHADASTPVQELVLRVGARSRPVIDLADPKDPKRRNPTLE